MTNTNSGLPVKGYLPQTDDNINCVNFNKVLEERVLRQLDEMVTRKDFDQRMVAIGRTKIQEAFMWINRAVFQPSRIALPEDTK